MAGADGSAGPGAGHGWRWDVALSFAAAQRDYVEQVARALQAQGVRCFYDADEEIDLLFRVALGGHVGVALGGHDG